MDNTKKFNNYLVGAIGTTEGNLKMRHQILNVHTTMQKFESFKKLEVHDQLDYCVTIIRIAVHTSTDDLFKIRPCNRNETFEYSIYKQ
jgi:hypothetical protein